MKQQTAVEWFFSELERMQYFIGNDMLEAYKEAKAMEKEQIKLAFSIGMNSSVNYFDGVTDEDENYYNETYDK